MGETEKKEETSHLNSLILSPPSFGLFIGLFLDPVNGISLNYKE
jgi:hypothetical protein